MLTGWSPVCPWTETCQGWWSWIWGWEEPGCSCDCSCWSQWSSPHTFHKITNHSLTFFTVSLSNVCQNSSDDCSSQIRNNSFLLVVVYISAIHTAFTLDYHNSQELCRLRHLPIINIRYIQVANIINTTILNFVSLNGLQFTYDLSIFFKRFVFSKEQ